jgi:hypothetical protein
MSLQNYSAPSKGALSLMSDAMGLDETVKKVII